MTRLTVALMQMIAWYERRGWMYLLAALCLVFYCALSPETQP